MVVAEEALGSASLPGDIIFQKAALRMVHALFGVFLHHRVTNGSQETPRKALMETNLYSLGEVIFVSGQAVGEGIKLSSREVQRNLQLEGGELFQRSPKVTGGKSKFLVACHPEASHGTRINRVDS